MSGCFVDEDRARRIGLRGGEYWVKWLDGSTPKDGVHILKANGPVDAAQQAAAYFDRSAELNELRVSVIDWRGSIHTIDLEARCVKEWDAKLVRT